MRCDNANDFRQDLGTLVLQGPVIEQKRTCIAGQTCAFSGILGQDLRLGDLFMILDTCSAYSLLTSPRLGTVGGWIGSANVTATRNATLTANLTVGHNGASVSWGTGVVTAEGGQYRMCWCAEGHLCSRAEHFSVDVGELVLVGPSSLDQKYTCVSGQTCSIDGIMGQHLSSADYITVLDTCDAYTSVPRLPVAGEATVSQSGASFTFGNA